MHSTCDVAKVFAFTLAQSRIVDIEAGDQDLASDQFVR